MLAASVLETLARLEPQNDENSNGQLTFQMISKRSSFSKIFTTLPKSAKNSKTGSRGMQNEKCWLRVETVFLILVNQDFSSNELRVWILDLVPRFGDPNTGHMKTKVLHSNNLKTILSGA